MLYGCSVVQCPCEVTALVNSVPCHVDPLHRLSLSARPGLLESCRGDEAQQLVTLVEASTGRALKELLRPRSAYMDRVRRITEIHARMFVNRCNDTSLLHQLHGFRGADAAGVPGPRLPVCEP